MAKHLSLEERSVICSGLGRRDSFKLSCLQTTGLDFLILKPWKQTFRVTGERMSFTAILLHHTKKDLLKETMN